MNMKMKGLSGLILVAAFICLTHLAAQYAKKVECETRQIVPKEKLLDVPLAPQETELWCWAASGEMIMKALGKNVSQGEQVNIKLNRNDCLLVPTPGDCVTGGWPEYEKYGLSICPRYGGLTCRELAEEIANKRPVGFSWSWKDSKSKASGHYMVARGYIIIDDIMLVVVNDPAPVNKGTIKIMTYSDYVAFEPVYTHWFDHYKIMGIGKIKQLPLVNGE
jgi:hypothetical protein